MAVMRKRITLMAVNKCNEKKNNLDGCDVQKNNLDGCNEKRNNLDGYGDVFQAC